MKEYSYLFAVLMFIYTLFYDKFPLTAAVILITIALIRTESLKSLLLIPVFLLIVIPRYSSEMPSMKEGKAMIVKENYSILENGRERVLIYSDEPLLFDAVYTINDDLQHMESTSSFYGFNTKRWTKQIRTEWNCNSVVLKKENVTVRSLIQKRIQSFLDSYTQHLLNQILLNIHDSSTDIDPSVFSYAGMIMITDHLLSYFLTEKKRKTAIMTFLMCLSVVYRFPFLLVQTLIFRLLKLTEMNRKEQIGTGYLLILLLYPDHVTSVAFLLPCIYRISETTDHNGRIRRYFHTLLIQSYLMGEVNPIRNILYPWMILFSGCGWWLGILTIITGIPFIRMMSIEILIRSLISSFTITGSVLGCGTVFFVLFCTSMRRHRYKYHIYTALFFVFALLGLFHPFAEVTFINVGQGDSILISAPLHSQNILIDTAKPGRWNALQTYLDAKGIHTIDTLIITHSDDDHAGNMDSVIARYHVRQLITAHNTEISSGFLKLYNLNQISNEDTNESSLVLAFQINGLKYLFMGDVDQYAEEEIVRNYKDLDCDILKLSHHGSKTGTSLKLIETVQPEVAIISAGSADLYHHPSEETIQTLLQFHIPYFNTYEDGDLSIICFPFVNLFLTSTFKIFLLTP